MRTGAWLITKDHISGDEPKDVHVSGPQFSRFWDENTEDRKYKRSEVLEIFKKHPDAQRFKLYDDDGELYYEGIMVEGEGGEDDCFGPLDDYGTPNAGAVTLKYLDKSDNTWKVM